MIGAMERVWKLGHVYDVTKYVNDLAQADKMVGIIHNDGTCIYEHGYFICHDVLDTHIYRIQVGINSEYEKEERTKIIESKDISHEDLVDFCIEKFELNKTDFDVDTREKIEILIEKIGLQELLKTIVEMDYNSGFENDDVDEFRYDKPLEALIRRIDGGYGITKIDSSEKV